MFNQFAKRNGEVDLTTRVEVHEHGTNASPAAVVEVLLAKIIAWQFRVYGRRVLGIPYTIWLLTTWATKWIAWHLNHPPRPKPRQQHSRYSPEQAAVGRTKGNATKAANADRNASLAKAALSRGETRQTVADSLGVSINTVDNYKKRDTAWVERLAALSIPQYGTNRTGTLQSDRNVPVKTTAIPTQPAESAPTEPQRWRIPNTRAANHGLSSWLLL